MIRLQFEGFIDGFVFNQNNALCHKSTHTVQNSEIHKITLLEWPVQNTDLNLIENVYVVI